MKYAGNYKIIGRIQTFGDDEVVMGFSELEALPYGVWITINGVLGSGEYFNTKKDAVNEMLRWLGYYDRCYDI